MIDIDNDGDLDIITNEFNDRPQLLISNLTEKKKINFLKIKLFGRTSNRNGLGAKVSVLTAGKRQMQINDGKSGYLAQSSIPMYFGLGTATKVDAVEVQWPSGIIQRTQAQVEPNQTLTLSEPDDGRIP